MKILFLSDNFPPEVNAPATRTFEHCREWVKAGAEVTVITCFPNFPKGEIFGGYSNKLRQEEEVDGIRVIRIWSYMSSNSGFLKRTLDYLSYAAGAIFHGLFENADVIVATSPQFFTSWGGWMLSKIKRTPWVFELRDLWPESIVTVGAMEKGRLYQFLEKIELSLYKSADMVIPNTPAFRDNLIGRGIIPDKINVIPNGSNLDLFNPEIKSSVKQELDLEGKFVFGYIGTHGLAHSLEFIIDSINTERLSHCHFLFIGDGAKKQEIKEQSEILGLNNVTFLDPIAKEQIPQYIAATDAALVPLKKSDTFKTVIPSKIFESAAMGKPILLGVEGQAWELVNEFEAGIQFEPENKEAFVSAAEQISKDEVLYSRLSRNAVKLAQAYDRKKLAKEMLDLLNRVY